MKKTTDNLGFSTVELLITLFIAAAFLVSGYQLYGLVMRESGEANAQARASNTAYDYLQRYKTTATNPCSATTIVSGESVTVEGLADVIATVSISCPYSTSTSVSRVQATIQYGNPQQTVTNATYVSPTTSANTTGVQSHVTRSPATSVDDASIGNKTWSDPGNATASDDVHSRAAFVAASTRVQENSIKIVKGGSITGTDKSTNVNMPLSITADTYVVYGSASDLWGTTWTYSDINASNFGIAFSVKDDQGNSSHYLKLTNFGFSIPSGTIINGILAEVENRYNFSPGVATEYVDYVRITVYYTTP